MAAPALPELRLGRYGGRVSDRLESLADEGFVERMWSRDASLWTQDPQEQETVTGALGWLDVAEKMVQARGELDDFAAEVREAGFRHVVYMGMGGSSLCPLVFERSFPVGVKGLPLTVLDTTDPATIQGIEASVPLEETLFFIASKSGTTAEPQAFGEYFYHRIRELKGDYAGGNMAVVTDPGSKMIKTAEDRDYRRVFLNFPDIGGRFSALSWFGLVPATLLGVDMDELLSRAVAMTGFCRLPEPENPGVILGAVMGELASLGRDKVTLVVPQEIETLGAWLEQLMAESTGKQGKGLVPVAGEPLGEPDEYGEDRLFIHMRLAGKVDTATEAALDALVDSGQPLVTIEIADKLDLGQEFYRWEIATATAGAVLDINAFDQPNVQESKDNTNRLLEVVSREGSLPAVEATARDRPLTFYGGEPAPTAEAALSLFLGQSRPGDYLAILAYLSEKVAVDAAIRRLRTVLRLNLGLATTAGYGPRYLHSTGQLHKGGPNSGLFLLLTARDSLDAAIPGAAYGFRTFRDAQALGDMEALKGHGRRVLRVDLGEDAAEGLATLEAATAAALAD